LVLNLYLILELRFHRLYWPNFSWANRIVRLLKFILWKYFLPSLPMCCSIWHTSPYIISKLRNQVTHWVLSSSQFWPLLLQALSSLLKFQKDLLLLSKYICLSSYWRFCRAKNCCLWLNCTHSLFEKFLLIPLNDILKILKS
jgi:hypothetical protein